MKKNRICQSDLIGRALVPFFSENGEDVNESLDLSDEYPKEALDLGEIRVRML